MGDYNDMTTSILQTRLGPIFWLGRRDKDGHLEETNTLAKINDRRKVNVIIYIFLI